MRHRSHAKFWYRLFEDWWKTYPWRLADDKEPPSDDVEKMEALAQVGNDSKLKSEVETKLQEVSPLHFPASRLRLNDRRYSIAQRVKGWYSYRAAVRNSRHKSGVWFQVLKRIHEQANPRPRCRSVPQQFAFENPEIVDTAFAERYSGGKDLSRTQRMNYWSELAKSLVGTTYNHLADGLAKRAKETHEREMKEWGLGLDDIGEAEDVQS